MMKAVQVQINSVKFHVWFRGHFSSTNVTKTQTKNNSNNIFIVFE